MAISLTIKAIPKQPLHILSNRVLIRQCNSFEFLLVTLEDFYKVGVKMGAGIFVDDGKSFLTSK